MWIQIDDVMYTPRSIKTFNSGSWKLDRLVQDSNTEIQKPKIPSQMQYDLISSFSAIVLFRLEM